MAFLTIVFLTTVVLKIVFFKIVVLKIVFLMKILLELVFVPSLIWKADKTKYKLPPFGFSTKNC